jgi:hypothetical protein
MENNIIIAINRLLTHSKQLGGLLERLHSQGNMGRANNLIIISRTLCYVSLMSLLNFYEVLMSRALTVSLRYAAVFMHVSRALYKKKRINKKFA